MLFGASVLFGAMRNMSQKLPIQSKKEKYIALKSYLPLSAQFHVSFPVLIFCDILQKRKMSVRCQFLDFERRAAQIHFENPRCAILCKCVDEIRRPEINPMPLRIAHESVMKILISHQKHFLERFFIAVLQIFFLSDCIALVMLTVFDFLRSQVKSPLCFEL